MTRSLLFLIGTFSLYHDIAFLIPTFRSILPKTPDPMRAWLADHTRIQHAFIPIGAAWLNLIRGWWRIFRRKAFAGESLADADDIAYVTRIATTQLNRHAQTWVWGRPPPPHHQLRRRFVYYL